MLQHIILLCTILKYTIVMYIYLCICAYLYLEPHGVEVGLHLNELSDIVASADQILGHDAHWTLQIDR